MSGKTVLMFNLIEELLDKTVLLLNQIIEEMEMLERYVLMLLYQEIEEQLDKVELLYRENMNKEIIVLVLYHMIEILNRLNKILIELILNQEIERIE